MTEDEALVSRILAGDMESFRRLIKQHERLVAHMVGRIVKNTEDQEELCQDVFLKVYDKLKTFSFQSKLSTWIATIAYRHAINHLRKKRIPINGQVEWEDFKERFIDDGNLEEELADKDLEEHVMIYINQLPIHYRAVLTMYHVEGMNYQEIGKITDMPEGTVKNYLFRARNLLKEKVKKYLSTEKCR
ncbi:RNA polymerase sigma factor [Flammeovirgaceae bacterium]